jgi:hypothetical protein
MIVMILFQFGFDEAWSVLHIALHLNYLSFESSAEKAEPMVKNETGFIPAAKWFIEGATGALRVLTAGEPRIRIPP